MTAPATVRPISFIPVIAQRWGALPWIYLAITPLFAMNVAIVTDGPPTTLNDFPQSPILGTLPALETHSSAQRQGNLEVMDSYTYIGRVRKPLLQKLNPIWWFRNDDEEQLPDWYKPGWPGWLRLAFWNVRNPLQNFRCYVVGVQDRNYSVIGRAPVLTVQRDDLVPPETGFQWALLYAGDLWVPRPFISYSGRVVFQLGWQPSGFFGLKLNLHRG